ncbi:platelet-activating factor acetylhydrolase, isoform II-domain-containing protein [Plectosphaerella plurivora]|uniref:Putative phospholipase n=1 Tax=Plectosphaerella plurivora TaxID=936078 RepID=A0A9P9AA52_9PEZI|nr:platelet-activating factor acetylhydrolase, isoform II-domain-containing protein [Plectosphaerella plurivora]
MSNTQNYRDSVDEADRLASPDEFDAVTRDSVDAPIPMATYSPRPSEDATQPLHSQDTLPRWFGNPSTRKTRYRHWISQTTPTLKRIFRPRLTWRYILCSVLAVYVVFCWVRGSPLLATRLPGYTGPYRVGAIDIEVPLPGGPKQVADGVFKDSGDPAFKVGTVLATIYYPTTQAFRSRKARLPWVSRPVSLTAKGYAKMVHVDNFLIRPIFTFGLWAIGGSITIPAEVDAPLFTSEDGEKDGKFPLMVFSHGMASSRSDYTNFLGELASRGHIIAAVEHRDGSCPGSVVKLDDKDPGRHALFFRESDLLDEIDMEGFKKAQLAVRDAEIRGAIDLFHAIQKGEDIGNTRDSVSTLSAWEGRLDLDRLTVGGHSYGATGALQALSTVASSPTAIGGLILDPGKSSGPLNNKTDVPLLVVHSNSWSKSHSIFYGRPHFDAVRDLVRSAVSPSWFLTSLGTSHPSVTDAPLLEPWLLSWTTGARLNTKEALEEYVRVAEEFLNVVEKGKTEGLLAEKVTHEEYDKWVSEERRQEFPKDLARLWQIHVAPGENK